MLRQTMSESLKFLASTSWSMGRKNISKVTQSFYTEREQRNKSRFPNQEMRNAKYLKESENYIPYNFLSMQTNFPRSLLRGLPHTG